MTEQTERPIEWFRAAVEASPTAMLIVDQHGRIVLLNEETRRQFGYSSEELLGESVERLVPQRFREQHMRERAAFQMHPAARKMGMGRDLAGRRRDGSEFPAEIGLTPLETDDGLYVVAAIVDISARKELELAQQRLQDDLEQRVAARTAQLAESNEALARTNEELRQFVYIASHDLQTPLRGIASFAQLLQTDYQGRLDERADEYIARIALEAKHMHALINDLLAYTRVESCLRPFAPTDLETVCDEVVALLEPVIDDVGGEVTRDPLPVVQGDRSQLMQLLQNLIENGLKYHGESSPRVHIAAEKIDQGYTIAVRDNGIGIDPRHHERIFEMFRRLHTQEKFPGTGIGLAICRRIVQRHDGSIWLRSAVGQGSEFFFNLREATDNDRSGR